MPVKISELQVGKCFSKGKQVRRIIEMDNDMLVYESRGGKAGQWNSRQSAKKATFAAVVEKEVNCDWDPDFGGSAT